MQFEKLISLYQKTSKHSNYQILASQLQELVPISTLNVNSRYERERLGYIKSKISFSGKTLTDIGGNTGFFSFEGMTAGAKQVNFFEGNKDHSEFVQEAANVLSLEGRIKIFNQYLDFDTNNPPSSDMVILLNVLHHIGDDYGQSQSSQAALQNISETLKKMSFFTKEMIFQLGFNWKGDKKSPLFKNGTKEEMIEFITNSTKGVWTISHIGVAIRENNQLRYVDVNLNNIARDDSLGEFLNRPIFILERA